MISWKNKHFSLLPFFEICDFWNNDYLILPIFWPKPSSDKSPLIKYFSPMRTQDKNFVYEFCVLFTRHKIHKQNFCLVYWWVKNTLVERLCYSCEYNIVKDSSADLGVNSKIVQIRPTVKAVSTKISKKFFCIFVNILIFLSENKKVHFFYFEYLS